MIPVVLFCYNRPEHTKEVIQALLKNPEVQETELWVFSDGPKPGQELAVDAVREVLENTKNFKKVHKTNRASNYGLSKNIRAGISEVLTHFDGVIVLEDDLVPSQNFLAFMNQALVETKDNARVHSVSAFNYSPVKDSKNSPPLLNDKEEFSNISPTSQDSFLCPRFSCWGWGIWRDRWEKIDWNILSKKMFLKHKNFLDFHRASNDLPEIMLDLMDGKNNSWAILASWDMVTKKMLSLYPVTAKVKNIGFDGTGVHSTADPNFKQEMDDGTKRIFNFSNLENEQFKQAQISSFKNSMKRKLKNFFQYGRFF